IASLQKERGMAVVLITHDMGVVARMCRRVIVMYAGHVVEESPADELFSNPLHPYTRCLLRSTPRIDAAPGGRLPAIEGQTPDLLHLPPGCVFAPRCPWKEPRCDAAQPPLYQLGARKHACLVQATDGIKDLQRT
ncbi:MAG TPA: oligopeptide/dipeptide ABC transporter ATP-binding protein, partial [Pirellulales bacterium]